MVEEDVAQETKTKGGVCDRRTLGVVLNDERDRDFLDVPLYQRHISV